VRRHDPAQLIAGVRAGDRLCLAQTITWVENEHRQAVEVLAALYPLGGRSHIIGVTGAPGSGKSTLVTALARAIRAAGQTVAIVAVDPTSPFTGGAILGDRVRMRALSGDPGVFIRSMATRGSLGGLSKTTGDVITVLDAAGFDRILVETVGVGQAEVEIASTAHTTLVVEAPGLGDEIQAIKAGILEIADLLVVNKADRPGADKTVQALSMMLELEGAHTQSRRHHGRLAPSLPAQRGAPEQSHDAATASHWHVSRWRVEVLKTVAATEEGVEALRLRVEAHRTWLVESGEWYVREHLRAAHLVESLVRAELERRIRAQWAQLDAAALVEAVAQRRQDPYHAARRLLAGH
jgi:LAO/AO transport system kinase